MTSFQVEYTPPLGIDRQARVRVSHGDNGREVWTREFSKEDGHFETRMINRLVEHPHRASVSATSSRPRR